MFHLILKCKRRENMFVPPLCFDSTIRETSDDDDDLLMICNHHFHHNICFSECTSKKATNWSNYLPLRRKVKIIAAFSCYLLQGPLKCGQLQHDWFRWYFLQHIFTSRYEAYNYKTCLHVLHLLQQIKREVIPDDFFVL